MLPLPPRSGALALLGGFLLLAGVSAFALATNREVAHLALWRLRETASRSDFDLPPPAAAAMTTAADPGRDLERALALARHVRQLCDRPTRRVAVRWGSEPRMLDQLRAGAVADCWPRSVLLAAEARRAGFAARLWALEGDRFDGNPHTIPELYVPGEHRWVMLDVTMNARAVTPSGVPLGFLELRDRVLGGPGDSIVFVPITESPPRPSAALAAYYADRSRDAFLRGGAGLDPRERYGPLAPLSSWLDRLPEPAMKAAASLLGETGQVRHLHDAHNTTLVQASLVAKGWALAFVIGLAGATASALLAWRRGAHIFRPAADPSTRGGAAAAGRT